MRLDRDARWWHEGGEVLHARMAQALHEGIDRHPESGEYIVRLGARWCYLDVDDAPYVVRAFVPTADDIVLRLSDGKEEILDPTTLTFGHDGVLYARVRQGGFPARFSRPAFHAAMPLLEERDGAVVLCWGGRAYPIAGDPG